MRSYRGLLAGLALGLLLGGGSSLYAASQVASFPNSDAALRSIYNVLAAGIAVTGTTSTTPIGVVMSETTITLSPGVSTLLIAGADTTPRKHISLMNIDTGRANLNYGSAATYGQGDALDPASQSGGQGGGYSYEGLTLPSNAIYAISQAGTRISVKYGN